MKNHTRKPLLVGFLIASALATLPMVALAQAPAANPYTPAVAKPDSTVSTRLSGKVAALSDTSLTVDSRTVALTIATNYTKGGTAIGRDGVKVGDIVSVITTDDGQVAVTVSVTPSS